VLVLFPADSARSQSLRDLIAPVSAPRSAASSQPHPSVARIIVPERGGTSYGSGSLVDIHRDYAIVITNWHVVSDRVGDVSVQFPDGFQSAGKVLKVDKDWDLAAIGIWRPRAEPMRFSDRAPQIGEPLAIAGYGSGQWRLASGRCTQFVSPGSNFPPDMVEVSVEARQGDSGGPILNQQGEIAGVLFGAGRGATSGSNAPRVKLFLESVFPILREAPDSGLAANRDAAAEKLPVVANANWQRNNPNLGSDAAKTSAALLIEERSPDGPKEIVRTAAAPLVAARPTPSRATDAELKDWVAPVSANESSSDPQEGLVESPLRAARIHRAQLVNAPKHHDAGRSAELDSPGLVEPQDQTDCAKFDPAFPSLSGGVEGETYSLASTDVVETIPIPPKTETAPRAGLFDQGKTFLALLGVVTILFQLGKMLGGKAT
jgi:S1-C subfamily serine protease